MCNGIGMGIRIIRFLFPAFFFLKCGIASTTFAIPFEIEPSAISGIVEARGPGFDAAIHPNSVVFRPKDGRGEYEMRFDGADRRARVVLTNKLPGVSSYFIGAPEHWRTGIPQYGRAKAEGLYRGIDVEWHDDAGKLEYDFIVQPGGDPSRIRLAFSGTSALEIRPDGALAILPITGGEVRQRLSLYQVADGKRTAVDGGFRQVDAHHIGFQVGSYDRARPLIIDPELDFATLVSGSGQDTAAGIALDSAKNIYITGSTTSADFPGTTSGSGILSEPDIFVAKLDPTGTTLLYSTLVGSSGTLPNTAVGIAVDAAGSAYVAGNTTATNFPTNSCIGSAERSSAGPFAFKLNGSGTGLVWSTCLTANPSAAVHGIALSPSGNLFVVGGAGGSFPVTPGSAESVLPAPPPDVTPQGAFAAELNSSGSAYVYATYIGGSTGENVANGAALDSSGDLFVTGLTAATDFPVTGGAYQNTNHGDVSTGGSNAFVTRISPDGSTFLYSTYLGGQGADSGAAIAVDAFGNAYVTGTANWGHSASTSNPFPITPGVLYSSGSEFNGFLTKINPAGSGLVYSTYLPQESGSTSGFGIALNPDGSLYLGEFTSHTVGFVPATIASVAISGTKILSVNNDATVLFDSEFIPDILGSGLSADGTSVFVAGSTIIATGVATPGAFQEAPKGPTAGFVAKLDFAAGNLPTLNVDAQNLIFDQATAAAPAPIRLSITSSGAPIAFHLAGSAVSFSQTDGVTPAEVVATANASGFTGFQNPGYFTILAPGAANGIQEIPVYLNQDDPIFELTSSTPNGLLFEVSGSGAAPEQLTGTLSAVSDTLFRYGAGTRIAEPFTAKAYDSWLSVTPSSGTTPATLTFIANPAGLSNGNYSSEIALRNQVSPLTTIVSVSMIVGPHLVLIPPQSLQTNAGGAAVSGALSITSSGTAIPFTITQPSVSWLTLSSLTGTTPANPTVTVNPAGLSAGTYSTSLVVAGGGSRYTATVTFTVLTSSGAPAMTIAAVISSAAQPSGAGVAPGSLASVYGANLTNSTAQATSLPLPTQLGGVSVIIGGYTVPLLYVSAGQINLQIPSEILPGSSTVQVIGPLGSATGTVTIVKSQPGMFVNYSAYQAPIIVNPDGSLNDASHPAHPGDYVVLYMTGQGPLDATVPDGAAAPSDPPAHATMPVSVTIGGLNAPVAFAGLTPTLTALFQVNVQIPAIYDGTHALVVTVGSSASDVFPISVVN